MKTKQRDHSLLYTCWSSQFLNTADMTPLFISVLLAAVCLECRAQKDNVLQPEGDVTAAEGEPVTLGCLYNTSSQSPNLFWYKQDGNNSPEFILSRFQRDEGKTADKYKERFSSTLDSTSRSVPLKIQKLQLSDSAVYYCALQPTTDSLQMLTLILSCSSTLRPWTGLESRTLQGLCPQTQRVLGPPPDPAPGLPTSKTIQTSTIHPPPAVREDGQATKPTASPTSQPTANTTLATDTQPEPPSLEVLYPPHPNGRTRTTGAAAYWTELRCSGEKSHSPAPLW
ncbi:uncharacterized protein LOC119901631 [Micropterus salmoides]|uniref:uncharacterized protein LOC119901631 n=1 Tax=Micropterus salmoides TaxID=27706 RepID=UPI0018EB8571|nr:uncharacterized protein LOC119901631 [Micropterus salmoides]